MKSATIRRHSLPVIAALCLVAAVLGVGLVPKPASAYIGSYEWLGATYMGTEDPFFDGTNIVAYNAGATAQLVATVVNTTDAEISIDFARLTLGWSSEKEEADTAPKTIAKDTYAIFIWSFQVPAVSAASNLVVHNFDITVQYDVWGGDADRQWTTGDEWELVVYSEDQAACRDSIDTWDANNDAYTIWGYKAREMTTEAWYLYNKAEDQYASGDFAGAKENYANAVLTQEEAIKKDASSALTGETALERLGTSGTKGTGYLIAGIGILIAGIGLMLGALLWAIKGGKKPA